MTDIREAPYPSDARAKGWRFELDMERARQSDTWALAKPEVRPWLLMLWAVAWEQLPCGSLPDDDELIAARIDMPIKLFQKHKSILLRRWWKATDGRLYHDVLVQRVTEMIDRKRSESERKAAWRARKDAERAAATASVPSSDTSVPDMSRGTDAGQTCQSHGTDDTGTGTGTGTGLNTHTPVATPTAAGRVCGLMRKSGLEDANPGHPTLLKLLAAGTTDEEFKHAASESVSRGKGFAYAIGMLTKQRDAAAALSLQAGPMPARETPWAREARECVHAMTGGLVSAKPPGTTKETIDGTGLVNRAA